MEAPRKVVRQYALTSANDFPQRDPQDWQLLGSNDGGTAWTTLDVRRGEVFSRRHQRRVFALANPQAFNCYRLEIQSVSNPLEANSVQLAEIEPLGNTEQDRDPIPVFEDVITVQGEHAPSETRDQAFDGRAETKWLDYSSAHPESRSTWIQWRYYSRPDLVVTNFQQLTALKGRVSESHGTRIEAVVVGQAPEAAALFVLDGTGCVEMLRPRNGTEFGPGVRLLLQGTVRYTNDVVEFERVAPLAPENQMPAKPKHIVLDQPSDRGGGWFWAEAEGTVRSCVRVDNRLVFELEDDGRSLSVQVLHAGTGPAPPPDVRVRAEGICQTLLNPRGDRVPGILWLSSLQSLMAVGPTNATVIAPGNPRLPSEAENAISPLTEIGQIRRLGPEEFAKSPKVKIRAVVTEQLGAFVQDDTGGIEVRLDPEANHQEQTFGDLIELEGVGRWESGHGPVIVPEKVVVLGRGKLPPVQRLSYSSLASGKAVDQWVEIEAVVRATDGSHLLLDCEGREMMATIRLANASKVTGLVDATIRARGVAVVSSGARRQVQGIHLVIPSLACVEIEKAAVDPFSLPVRRIGRLLDFRSATELSHRIRIRGVVTLREDFKYFVQDPSGAAMAIPKQDVVLSTREGIESWVFWRSHSAAVADNATFAIGDLVDVVGFLEPRGYAPILTEALVHRVYAANPVAAVRADASDIALSKLDATLVTMEAELVREDRLRSQVVLTLQSGETLFRGFVQSDREVVPRIAAGSRLRVTGVCQFEPLPFAELGQSPPSFGMVIRKPGDITVLESPPWWTFRRTLTLCAGLMVLLAITLGWIRILHRQVDQRTRQLKREIDGHKQTEANLAEKTVRLREEIEERKIVQAELEDKKQSLENEIDERVRMQTEVDRVQRRLLLASRQAGMAEVATSVLHNVGNVLNSVNICTELISNLVRQSKAPGLSRLAAFLAAQNGDLEHFLAQDPRGRRIPAYLARLGAHLTDEQDYLLGQIKVLTDNVSHVKEIVARHQDYAKISGILETVTLAEIVNDALLMLRAAMDRHHIQVVADFEPAPPTSLDRHKILQILFNLLQNAKRACEESGRSDKRVKVQIRRLGKECVNVSVIDNGVGISAENLPRIFSQGFSTHKGGHGFGLHSSVLMAQDMGGSLTVRSGGLGEGAAFTLGLPARTGHIRREITIEAQGA
jgi:signal transduction histidine kinase